MLALLGPWRILAIQFGRSLSHKYVSRSECARTDPRQEPNEIVDHHWKMGHHCDPWGDAIWGSRNANSGLKWQTGNVFCGEFYI